MMIKKLLALFSPRAERRNQHLHNDNWWDTPDDHAHCNVHETITPPTINDPESDLIPWLDEYPVCNESPTALGEDYTINPGTGELMESGPGGLDSSGFSFGESDYSVSSFDNTDASHGGFDDWN